MFHTREEASKRIGRNAYQYDHFGLELHIPQLAIGDLCGNKRLTAQINMEVTDDHLSRWSFPPYAGGESEKPNKAAHGGPSCRWRDTANILGARLRAAHANLTIPNCSAARSRKSPVKVYLIDTGAGTDLVSEAEVRAFEDVQESRCAELRYSKWIGVIVILR